MSLAYIEHTFKEGTMAVNCKMLPLGRDDGVVFLVKFMFCLHFLSDILKEHLQLQCSR